MEEDKFAYIVVMEQGGLFAIHLSLNRAKTSAAIVEGVVLAVPIFADYRPKENHD